MIAILTLTVVATLTGIKSRKASAPLGRDRTLHRDLEVVERLIRSGSLLATVEDICGKLE